MRIPNDDRFCGNSVLGEIDPSALTSEIPPADPQELQRFKFGIICRSDAAMDQFWSVMTAGKLPTVIVRAETYGGGGYLGQQELFGPHLTDSYTNIKRPLLMRGCLGMMSNRHRRPSASCEDVCDRYFRRHKLTATKRSEVFDALERLTPRLAKKHYYVGPLFERRFLDVRYVLGHKFGVDDPQFAALGKRMGAQEVTVYKVREVVEKKLPRSEKLRKWKAAYDALRELGIES